MRHLSLAVCLQYFIRRYLSFRPQLSSLENIHKTKPYTQILEFQSRLFLLNFLWYWKIKKKAGKSSQSCTMVMLFFFYYFSQDHTSSIKSLLAKSAETSSYACIRVLPSAKGEKLQGCTLLVMTEEYSEKIPVLLTEVD